jgi:hypothetical protein
LTEPKTSRRGFVKYVVGGVVVAVAGVTGYYLTQSSPQPEVTSTVGSPTWTKVTGFNNPRGLKFGPDGFLYVAEAGLGGSTAAISDQVPPPVGPYSEGKTARISRIDVSGERTTVVEGLPSDQTSPALGGLVSGVADVDFIGNTLYALN